MKLFLSFWMVVAGIYLVDKCSVVTVDAFSPVVVVIDIRSQHTSPSLVSSSTSLFMATKRKKKKPSMAERRQRRQEKMRGQNTENPYENLPPPKFDFTSSSSDDDKEEDSSKKETVHVANPTAAAEKAKELLKAQRDSVSMLTLVKERIESRLRINPATVESLQSQGFAIVDDFLNDESTLLDLEEEGRRMAENGDMTVDTANLGTGEYITALQGGEKQYALCPRMVEFVVSSTKHFPEVFDGDEETKFALDPSACMATLRAFDRKALKASLALLTGNDDDHVLDAQANPSPLEVVANEANDQRRLSMYYYVLPKDWDENCGGGLTFESGVAAAKRDRLVIFYSDSTKCKTIPWKGSDSSTSTVIGNSIELHLVNKR